MNDNDRAIVGFTTVSHGLVHTYELSIPILMTIWLIEFPLTTATLGTVVTVGYGLMGIGALPSGVLTDTYGSRLMIVSCLAGMGSSFLVLSAASGLLGISVALALWGAAASLYHPAGLSLLSKGVTVQGQAFGIHGMGGNAGIALGPLVTALLLLTLDWQLVTALLAIPALVTAAYGLSRDFEESVSSTANPELVSNPEVGADGSNETGPEISEETLKEKMSAFRGDTGRLFTVGFVMVFLAVMCNGLFYRGILTFLPELLDDFLRNSGFSSMSLGGGDLESELNLGRYLYSGLLMIGIMGQYTGGRIVDRFPLEWSFATILGILAIIAVAFVPAAMLGVAPLLVVSAVLGFTMFSVQPISQATVASYSPSDLRGLSYGFTYLAVFGIGALGASITGVVLTYGTVSTTFLVQALTAAVGSAVCLVLLISQSKGGDD
jgi:MFS family permease